MRKTKKTSFVIFFTAIALFFLIGNLSSQQTAEELFEKALVMEEAQGDLQKAIELYEEILSQYPESREIAAKAQLHIGLCYEKLGLREATNAYQKVVQNYGEQKEAVAQARVRLSKLTQTERKSAEPEGIRIRQIWKKPYTDFLGTVSPDGRFLSFVHWGKGDLAIRDLVTGEERILTHDADAGGGSGTGFAQEPTISKNGKQIAYSWWKPQHTYELYVVDVDHPSPSLVYKNEGEHVYPAAWLSDKELIISRLKYQEKIGILCSLDLTDGTVRELKRFDRQSWPQAACSLDEKYTAYDFAGEKNAGNFDINVIAMEDGRETALVKHPANDRVLGWVPGSEKFLFLSDRTGTWDLWAVPVVDGKPSGPEKRIYTDIGEVGRVGFTREGNFFFGFNRRNFNAYIAPLNAETGELKEKSGKSLLGSNYWIRWSPDGQHLAYIKENRNASNPWQLTLQDVKTGEERKIANNIQMAMSPCCSPDGKSILITGIARDESSANGRKAGVYIVDVETGLTTEIFNLSEYKDKITPPDDDAFPLSDLQWSSDGKSIFYLFFTDRLVKRDLETGEEKILYRHNRFDRGVLTRSPDGKSLLLSTKSPDEKISRLFTIPVGGGEETLLCKAQEAVGFDTALWSPDGKYIYFAERSDGTSLWRIPAEGGVPQKIWQSKNWAEFFGIHPDGGQIAMAVRELEMEIRVIENLVQELEKIYGK
jgi:Tol biopolymer transport system component